jgi:glutamine transport system substrate-binding protein
MKKKLSVLWVAMVLAMIFTACSSASTGAASSSAPTASAESTQPSSAAESTAPKKTLNVLTYANWNPFEYLDKGQMVGFDIDLMKALADEAGYQYEIKNSGWDEMFTQLQSKSADMGISGITITDDRKQTYDFSVPYILSKQSMVVKENGPIKSAEDIKSNKTVGVQNGSTGQEAVEKILGKNNSHIKKYKNGLQYMALTKGEIDVAVGDDTNNQNFLNSSKDAGVKIIQDEKAFAPEYFGLMFPKGSELKPVFDKAINTLLDNGKYAEIYKKWFKVDADIAAIKAKQ